MSKNKIRVKQYREKVQTLKKEVSKVVTGQEKVVNSIINGLLCQGSLLVEGVPGTAKTLIVKTMAKASGCSFNRIQFTIDLLPSDIVGITAYDKKKGFYTIKGPIFSNFVIADEINRATPKSQSALLEAMAEKQVTIGNKTYRLQEPFFVMATQNPIESSGTYPLPEAQIDRFLLKINIGYPSDEEEIKILKNNITLIPFDDYKIKKVITPKILIEMHNFVKDEIYLDKKIEKYIVKITQATRNPQKYGIKSGKYIEYGCSTRGAISLYIASKADALMNGKDFVTPQNVKNVATEVLRHRILLNYEGQAEQIATDDIIDEILKKIKIQ